MRVLVVEDETSLAEVVRRGLTQDGFVVDVMHNGEDGLWAATENAYDVIVLDIMLPRLERVPGGRSGSGGGSLDAGADAHRRRTATSTRPTRSTSARTTTSPSRSASWS